MSDRDPAEAAPRLPPGRSPTGPVERAVTAVGIGLLRLAPDGMVISHNSRAAELLDRADSSLVGLGLWPLLPEISAQRLRPLVRHAAERETPLRMECLLEPGGRCLEIRGTFDPQVGEVVLLVDEITARKRSESHLAFVAEASSLFASSLDYPTTLASLARLAVPRLADYCLIFERVESGRVRLVARAHADPGFEPHLERLGQIYQELDAAPESAIGRVFGSGEPVLVDQPSATAAAGAGAHHPELLELYARLAPRSVVIVPLAARDQMLGIASLAYSTSPSRYSPENLPLVQELALRAALAIDNARLFREVQEANSAKDRFLATLSHELRTPLTPVLAIVSELERDRELSAETRRRLGLVRRNVQLEAHLIDDLLDLTRIARGMVELRREPTDLAAVLAHVLETIDSELTAAGITVELALAAEDHRLLGDPARLTQIFWNLIHNAIKFTPPGGTLSIESRRLLDDAAGESLVVRLADSGVGIEPEALERIFESFEQGEPALSRHHGGLGVGLAVTRALVRLHGGRIHAESPGRGQGATFTVVLPAAVRAAGTRMEELAPTATTAATALSEPPSGDRGERPSLDILLVEDHPASAEALAELLTVLGHRVRTAATREAAHQGVSERMPDLLVSDLDLPDGTGYDLLTEIATEAGADRPVAIALSGYGRPEDVARSRDAGFVHHLVKPITLETLERALERFAGAPAASGSPS